MPLAVIDPARFCQRSRSACSHVQADCLAEVKLRCCWAHASGYHLASAYQDHLRNTHHVCTTTLPYKAKTPG